MNAGGVDKACKSNGCTSLGSVQPAEIRRLNADIAEFNAIAHFLLRTSAFVLRCSAGYTEHSEVQPWQTR